jgi:hypothetical protein
MQWHYGGTTFLDKNTQWFRNLGSVVTSMNPNPSLEEVLKGFVR